MNDKITVAQFLATFDHHRRVSGEGDKKNVILYPNLHGVSFIELTEEFHASLKKDLEHKLLMAECGIEPLDATTKFAIMLLEGSW